MTSQTQTTNTLSVADELKKFKELLDMGAITQDEFDTKKKELLGL
jgi:predicted Zn-dependent peptidase